MRSEIKFNSWTNTGKSFHHVLSGSQPLYTLFLQLSLACVMSNDDGTRLEEKVPINYATFSFKFFKDTKEERKTVDFPLHSSSSFPAHYISSAWYSVESARLDCKRKAFFFVPASITAQKSSTSLLPLIVFSFFTTAPVATTTTV